MSSHFTAEQLASRRVVVGCLQCARRIVVDAKGEWVHEKNGRAECYTRSGDKFIAAPGIDSIPRYTAALKREVGL